VIGLGFGGGVPDAAWAAPRAQVVHTSAVTTIIRISGSAL